MALTGKQVLKSLAPPLLWRIGKDLKRRMVRSVDHFAYAPDGWSTRLPPSDNSQDFWSTLALRERASCEALIATVQASGPVLALNADLKDALYAYVVALTAAGKHTVSILDYGGHLGERYWVARAMVPEVALEFHCKELARVAEEGRNLSPDVTWHTDDECLAQQYDLVLFSGCLQCVPEWQHTLRRAAQSARNYLFILDVPTVRNVPTFVVTQRCEGITSLQHQLNHSEIIATAEGAGWRLMREFDMGSHPPVANAPEQPRCAGLLFQRDQRK
jgi:putative methyltransferase (TIGR04325 family)